MSVESQKKKVARQNEKILTKEKIIRLTKLGEALMNDKLSNKSIWKKLK